MVKSFSDTQPDFGFASKPVEVQRYVDGRVHVPGGGGGRRWSRRRRGRRAWSAGSSAAEGRRAVLPVQVTPFTAKLVGAGLLPVHDPLKPNDTVPLVGTEPL